MDESLFSESIAGISELSARFRACIANDDWEGAEDCEQQRSNQVRLLFSRDLSNISSDVVRSAILDIQGTNAELSSLVESAKSSNRSSREKLHSSTQAIRKYYEQMESQR